MVQHNICWYGEEATCSERVVKIFVTRDRPFLFPVQCEISFFLINSRSEPWFSKMFFRIVREAWNANIIVFVNCESAVLISEKRDLYPYPPPPPPTLSPSSDIQNKVISSVTGWRLFVLDLQSRSLFTSKVLYCTTWLQTAWRLPGTLTLNKFQRILISVEKNLIKSMNATSTSLVYPVPCHSIVYT